MQNTLKLRLAALFVNIDLLFNLWNNCVHFLARVLSCKQR